MTSVNGSKELWFDRTPRRLADVPPPWDPALPNLRDVWQGMGTALERGLGMAQVETRPRYIKYKPGNKAILLHDVLIDGVWTCAKVTVAARKDLVKASQSPTATALSHRVFADWHIPASIVYLEDVDALVEWYPANIEMPGLSAPRSDLFGPLVDAGATIAPDETPALVNYRPERRAVLRWGDVYLKVYAMQEHFERAAKALDFSARLQGLTAPEPLGHFPNHMLSAQRSLLGSLPERNAGARADMGRALRRLHQAPHDGLPAVSPATHLTAAKTTADFIVRLLPTLTGQVSSVVSALEARLPDLHSPVVSHGDFHRRQMLEVDGRIAMLDFDSMCVAHPAYDPAKFAASQVNGKSRNLDEAFSALSELLVGYGVRPPDLEWHMATHILRRSSKPFRYFKPSWPERIEGMIGAAASLLD